MGLFDNAPLRYFTPPFNIYPGLAPLTVLFGFAASGPVGAHDTHMRDVFSDKRHKIQFHIIPADQQRFVVYTRGLIKNGAHTYERVTRPMPFFDALQIITVLHDENAPLQKLYGQGPQPRHHPVNVHALREFNGHGVTPGIVTTRAILPPATLRAANNPAFHDQIVAHMARFHNNKADVMSHLDSNGELNDLRFLFGQNIGPAMSFFALRTQNRDRHSFALYSLSPVGYKRIGRTDDFDTACRTLGVLEKTYILPNIPHVVPTDVPVMHYSQWASDTVLNKLDTMTHVRPMVA